MNVSIDGWESPSHTKTNQCLEISWICQRSIFTTPLRMLHMHVYACRPFHAWSNQASQRQRPHDASRWNIPGTGFCHRSRNIVSADPWYNNRAELLGNVIFVHDRCFQCHGAPYEELSDNVIMGQLRFDCSCYECWSYSLFSLPLEVLLLFFATSAINKQWYREPKRRVVQGLLEALYGSGMIWTYVARERIRNNNFGIIRWALVRAEFLFARLINDAGVCLQLIWCVFDRHPWNQNQFRNRGDLPSPLNGASSLFCRSLAWQAAPSSFT